MWRSNPTWGKRRIQAELAKIGIQVSDSTVWRYRLPRGNSPSQSWRAFLDNHVRDIVAIDFVVVPTATFRALYVLLIMSHDRRRILHFNVMTSPSAQWTAKQVIHAFPYESAPRFLLHDRDSIFGNSFVRRVESMGIKEVVTDTRLAVAKTILRASNRIDPLGMPRPRHPSQRTAPPTGSWQLRVLLPLIANAPVIGRRLP